MNDLPEFFISIPNKLHWLRVLNADGDTVEVEIFESEGREASYSGIIITREKAQALMENLQARLAVVAAPKATP